MDWKLEQLRDELSHINSNIISEQFNKASEIRNRDKAYVHNYEEPDR
jgi:hypothetical protein